MSRKCYFQVTKFVDYDCEMRERDTSFGYRVFDGVQRDYFNLFRKEYLPTTPEEALVIIQDSHPNLFEDVEFCDGFYFNEEWITVKDGKVVCTSTK